MKKAPSTLIDERNLLFLTHVTATVSRSTTQFSPLPSLRADAIPARTSLNFSPNFLYGTSVFFTPFRVFWFPACKKSDCLLMPSHPLLKYFIFPCSIPVPYPLNFPRPRTLMPVFCKQVGAVFSIGVVVLTSFLCRSHQQSPPLLPGSCPPPSLISRPEFSAPTR